MQKQGNDMNAIRKKRESPGHSTMESVPVWGTGDRGSSPLVLTKYERKEWKKND